MTRRHGQNTVRDLDFLYLFSLLKKWRNPLSNFHSMTRNFYKELNIIISLKNLYYINGFTIELPQWS